MRYMGISLPDFKLKQKSILLTVPINNLDIKTSELKEDVLSLKNKKEIKDTILNLKY